MAQYGNLCLIGRIPCSDMSRFSILFGVERFISLPLAQTRFFCVAVEAAPWPAAPQGLC